MTKTNHEQPIWQLLDRLQMDLGAMSAKLTELRAHVASLDLAEVVTHGQWQPALGVTDPAMAIGRQIANGALTTTLDLEAELRAHPSLTPEQRDELRAQLTNKEAA